MNTIEISTSHNIVVSFELATTIQRILAWTIDGFIVLFYSFFVNIVVGGYMILTYILIFLVVSFYHFIFEVFNKGQSPGKMLLKIRVVTLHGRMPSVNDYFMRWIFRMVDIAFSLGMLAVMFIMSSKKNQRIGDIISQTSVVKQRNENAITLQSILNLDKAEEILYPRIKEFSDEDMLLLKQSLLRFRQHPNDSIKEVLREISQKIATELDVDLRNQNRSKFLDRVLYEYILLTR